LFLPKYLYSAVYFLRVSFWMTSIQ